MTTTPLIDPDYPVVCWAGYTGEWSGAARPRCGRPLGHEGRHMALVYGSDDPASIREERW